MAVILWKLGYIGGQNMMYIRPFHYPEDHGGLKPKEVSPFVDPKSKISEKLDQNWSCLGQKTISISRAQPICQIWRLSSTNKPLGITPLCKHIFEKIVKWTTVDPNLYWKFAIFSWKCLYILAKVLQLYEIRRSLVVSAFVCHPGGWGTIPDRDQFLHIFLEIQKLWGRKGRPSHI